MDTPMTGKGQTRGGGLGTTYRSETNLEHQNLLLLHQTFRCF